jgi:hypothetical protein
MTSVKQVAHTSPCPEGDCRSDCSGNKSETETETASVCTMEQVYDGTEESEKKQGDCEEMHGSVTSRLMLANIV